MFQEQIGEILFLRPGKLSLFLVLALFFHRSFSELDIEQGYPLKKFRLDKLGITASTSNCKKAVFNYVFCKKS